VIASLASSVCTAVAIVLLIVLAAYVYNEQRR
jgi:hypothetical protein